MELTIKQQEGLKIAVDRFRSNERYTTISGYAGSGKSTLIKFIVDALQNFGIESDDVAYACYTGKAAQVLIDKGLPAITLHKLLYKSVPKPDGTFMHIPVEDLRYKLIIIDEISMVPNEMITLLSHYTGTYYIFCGDPFQLPPISKSDENHILDTPHIFLDEIMRQAKDSGIIQLSMKIRNGESLTGFDAEDAIVLPKGSLNKEIMQWSDIIIAATNNTRINLNKEYRQYLGYTQPIEPGEKLICLHNDWDKFSENNNALTNGCIGYLNNVFESEIHYPYYVYRNNIRTVIGNFVTETGDNFGSLEMDKNEIITGIPTLDNKKKYEIKRKGHGKLAIPYDFTYGYCITCHKSQGSSWDKVVVVEEGFPFSREEHARWLYTAVTRAEKRLVIAKKD